MRKYESIFILKPDVNEEQITSIMGDINKIVQATKEKRCGIRKLPFSLQGHTHGYYVAYGFEQPNNVHDGLIHYYKNNELILKFIIVPSDKFGG